MTGLSQKLKKALSEYYLVADMENYDLVFRAIGHFIHKWGRIDRFESLNEHWLDLEAGIRTDFNIFGTKLDFVKNLKKKSRMRAFFRKSGVETIPQRTCSDRAGALTFIRRVGYPVVVKPDSGSGARTPTRSRTPRNSTTSFARSRRAYLRHGAVHRRAGGYL